MKKAKGKAKNNETHLRRRAVVLPDDACPRCRTIMKEKSGRLSLPINGEEIMVPDQSHLGCPKCGEVILRLDEVRHLREAAMDTYRKKYGLLSGDEIRSVRERFNLTQADFARLLHLGSNTISRWEAGRNVQTSAMNMLLRLIRDLPGSLDYLREHAA